jgi:hypothetical protein
LALGPSWVHLTTFPIRFFSGYQTNLLNQRDFCWQEWRDSNPQPPVLETGALAIELHSCGRDDPAGSAATGFMPEAGPRCKPAVARGWQGRPCSAKLPPNIVLPGTPNAPIRAAALDGPGLEVALCLIFDRRDPSA